MTARLEECIVGLLSFVLAAGTIHLTSDGRDVAAVWPANAVLLAALLGRRQGAGIGAGTGVFVAGRLQEALRREPMTLDDGTVLPLAMSCGVALHRPRTSFELCAHEADMALYAAQRAGRKDGASGVRRGAPEPAGPRDECCRARRRASAGDARRERHPIRSGRDTVRDGAVLSARLERPTRDLVLRA